MGQFTNQPQAMNPLLQMLQGIIASGGQQNLGMGGMQPQRPMNTIHRFFQNGSDPVPQQNIQPFNASDAQVNAYRTIMGNPGAYGLNGTTNASEVAAHMALYGQGPQMAYGGLRTYGTPEGNNVAQFMKQMQMPATDMGGGGFAPIASMNNMQAAASYVNQPQPFQKAINNMNGGDPTNPLLKKPTVL